MVYRGLEPVRVPAGFWDRDDVLAALAVRDMTALFRLLKKWAGASQMRVAISTGLSQSRVSKIINGKNAVVKYELVERIAEGLGMPDAARLALGLAPRGNREAASSPPADAPGVPAADANGLLVAVRELVSAQAPTMAVRTQAQASLHVDGGDAVRLELRWADGRIVPVSLSRREFTHLCAAGALRAFLPAGIVGIESERASKGLGEPRHLDPHLLGYFRTMLTEHYAADKMLGPRRLIGSVLAQIDVLDGLRRHARPGTANEALRLLSQYAEFAGWLHQDAGEVAAAMYWSDRATEWAQATGDQQMVAYMLVRKSNIALLADDAVRVIDLAAAACHVPGPISPKLTALAAQQEARGWALRGEPDRFRAHLDLAADLLSSHPGDVDEAAPVYLHHYDLDTLEEQSASCYRASGQAETAVAILERKIAATPEHLHRDRGHQLSKLANTVLATSSPDPERAAGLGLTSFKIARETGSARIVKEVRALDAALTRRWPTLPGAVELHEVLAAAA